MEGRRALLITARNLEKGVENVDHAVLGARGRCKLLGKKARLPARRMYGRRGKEWASLGHAGRVTGQSSWGLPACYCP